MERVRSEEITIAVAGDKFTGYFARSDPAAPKVLLYHAWWGLTPFFQNLAAQLAHEGFTVFAPDLYDGQTTDTIQGAEEMLQKRDLKRHAFIAASAVEWMLAQPANHRGLGLVGFSMGGGWALDLAGRYPEAVKAVVLYYASGDGDYEKMRARFLGHFAGHDDWTPESEVAYVEKEMRAHGIQHEFLTYPQAEHWFVETNRPEYREEDAVLAWTRTVKFLRESLA